MGTRELLVGMQEALYNAFSLTFYSPFKLSLDRSLSNQLTKTVTERVEREKINMMFYIGVNVADVIEEELM